MSLDTKTWEFHQISRALEKACFENNLYQTGLLLVCFLSRVLALELTGANEEPSDLISQHALPCSHSRVAGTTILYFLLSQETLQEPTPNPPPSPGWRPRNNFWAIPWGQSPLEQVKAADKWVWQCLQRILLLNEEQPQQQIQVSRSHGVSLAMGNELLCMSVG